MKITVNGTAQTYEEGACVADVLAQAQLIDKRVAVELNGAIVPKSAHMSTRLKEADRLEIVHAIGGG